MTMPEKILVCDMGYECEACRSQIVVTEACFEPEGETASYTLTSIMDTRIAELEAEVERLRAEVRRLTFKYIKTGTEKLALNGDSHDA